MDKQDLLQTHDLLQPVDGWLDGNFHRVTTPTKAEWGWLLRIFSSAARFFKRPELPNIFPVFNLNPRIFWAWLFFASRLMPFGRLPGKLREKVILRVAWNTRCRYEWVQHLDMALAIKVSDEDIIKVSRGADAFDNELDKLVMIACDQIHKNKMLDEHTWQALTKHFKNNQMIELIILVGHYEMVAGFLLNMGVQTEPHIEKKLVQFHERIRSII